MLSGSDGKKDDCSFMTRQSHRSVCSASDFFTNSQGISGSMPKIDQSVVETAPIPIPPLAEQEQIVAETEQQLSVIEELDAMVSANFRRATQLRQSILQRAFNGKIV